MDMREIDCERVDRINLDQDRGQWRVVNIAIQIQRPIDRGTFVDQISDF
jgi:hypothetical protein